MVYMSHISQTMLVFSSRSLSLLYVPLYYSHELQTRHRFGSIIFNNFMVIIHLCFKWFVFSATYISISPTIEGAGNQYSAEIGACSEWKWRLQSLGGEEFRIAQCSDEWDRNHASIVQENGATGKRFDLSPELSRGRGSNAVEQR